MADSNETSKKNVFSENDTLDINELASLNEEISDDFIEQLQNQITTGVKSANDGDLFEEATKEEHKSTATFNDEIDDNFIKKYKAKLNKKNNDDEEFVEDSLSARKSEEADDEEIPEIPLQRTIKTPKASPEEESKPETEIQANSELVSIGDISEKPLTEETKNYNEKLDYLDSNVKYSKYVIYIDPENKEFIDSLTVKERKNLINRIIREQDAIAITRRRLGKIQIIITHAIVAILTVTIAIPCIYMVINLSLEATINNYRASQSIFEQLYKEKGKIQTNRIKKQF